jgi:oxidase EvaA
MLASENSFQHFSEFDHWFDEIKSSVDINVSSINFDQMKQWSFNSAGNLSHNTGRFFSIEGIDVDLNTRFNASWDQPIINQPEVGLLGILTKVFYGVRYFLMQAKIEPGNIGMVQLSPTVQATYSNLKKVHGGQSQHYIEFFQEDGKSSIIVDQLQSEQGARFYKKQNRNVIIDVVEEVPTKDGFRWLTLREIKLLLERNNIVNMDTRSVLSCIPGFRTSTGGGKNTDMLELLSKEYPAIRLDDFSCEIINSSQNTANTYIDLAEIDAWLATLKQKYSITSKLKPLLDLNDWEISDNEIRHKSEPFFSVIAVSVQASSREVTEWDQPLLKDDALGLMGFITKKINNKIHFLVQARIEAGSRLSIELSPTVSCSNYHYKWKRWNEEYAFLKYFMDPEPATVIYDSIQSEEGGRFYQFQNRNMIVQLDDIDDSELPENFIWMSLYQIEEYQKRGLCTVDTRTLLSSLFLRIT